MPGAARAGKTRLPQKVEPGDLTEDQISTFELIQAAELTTADKPQGYF